MRLLELGSNGEISLTEFGSDTPPYAILSHTWGADEVTFRDFAGVTDKNKAGYKKIRFCAEQAAKDGLRYFWVDTCCIDKSSSAELQEAINSMFEWYRAAVICYVYLTDVSTQNYENNDSSLYLWEPALYKSRWFGRGWTLQELLAPTSVEFFSTEGVRLGDKKALEEQINEITGIPIRALRGQGLAHFSVPERMSWAAHRETRRQEDKAYSLMGIFDVYIPILYGEGADRAFRRLKEEIDKISLQQAEKISIYLE